MKKLAILLLLPALGGCIAKAVVDTAVSAVTLPVKVASKGVDLATTSQAEADQKAGRELRKADEQRGRDARAMADRCQHGAALATDQCSAAQPR
jgi:hypothetical protein